MAQVRREWPGAVELEVTTGDGPLRALAYPALTGRPQAGDRVLLNATAVELGLGTGGYALVIAVPDRLPGGSARTGPSREGAVHAAAGLRPRGRRAGLTAPRGAPRCRRPGRDAGRRGRSPLRAACHPRRAARGGPAGRRVRDAGRRRAARLVLPCRGGAARGRVARGHDQHRPVVRRRPGDGHGAHRPAGGAPCAGRRGGRGDAGAGQPGHRHPLGVLRRGLRRGGERGRGARRPPGGVACGSARPTPGSATAASHTTASPPTAGWPWPVPTSWCPRSTAISARRSPPRRSNWRTRHRLVSVATGGLLEALAACPVPLATMGRGLDEDRAYFLAAAAAGRHAAALLA